MRRFPLDGAELWFDRATGLTLHHAAPSTAETIQTAPRVVQLGITNACNLRCAFCSRDRDAESSWTVEAAFDLLAGLARAGTLEVAFGGGEPLAFRGFDELVTRLHAETPLAVGVTSNGHLLDEARARRLAPFVSQFRISIYDDKDWRRSFRALRAAGASFGANLLVDRDRAERIEDIVLDLVSNGATDVLILSYVGTDDRLGPEEDRALGLRIEALARVLRGWADVKIGVCWGDRLGVPRLAVDPAMRDCGAGKDFIAVTSDRMALPCSFHQARVPFKSADDLLRIWRDARAFGAPAMRSGCARTLPVLRHRPRRVEQPTVHAYAGWASNNSGSYVLVGSFDDDAAARDLAARLERLFLDMRDAIPKRDAEAARRVAAGERLAATEPLPLEQLVAAEGLSPLGKAWEYEEWPSFPQEGARELLFGKQVVVHVGFTLSMPRALAELIAKSGGRIDVEIDHAHAPLVVVVEIWWGTAGGAERPVAVREEIDVLLPALLEAERNDGSPPVPHAWHQDMGLTLAFVALDPVEVLLRVREILERHDAVFRLRCFEALAEKGDPLAQLRM